MSWKSEGPGFDSGRESDVYLFEASGSTQGPKQPFSQRVSETFPLGLNRPGREVGHSLLAPMLGMKGSVPPLILILPWS